MPSLVDAVLDLAFPARCAGCDREGQPICATCQPSLDARLDLPPGVPIGIEADLPSDIVQLDWCAPFGGVVRKALHGLKYGGERRLAEPLGLALARRWERVSRGGDVLVPVPIHADRLRKRGYDQAELVARVAGRALGLPVAPIVERRRATIAQFDLDRAERAGNVAGAFGLARGAPDGRPLEGRWVVLVDDVVTTGSTLTACAAPLREAGALAVSAATIARER